MLSDKPRMSNRRSGSCIVAPYASSVHAGISVVENLAGIHDSIQLSHRSKITPAAPASNANSHTLIAALRYAEDSTSSGVPPPFSLPVDVDLLELEVELFVCDVPVEASEGDSGVTVTPTTATLVVVGSGVTVVGTTVVVEDVAAAWVVEVVDLVLVLVVDALASCPPD